MIRHISRILAAATLAAVAAVAPAQPGFAATPQLTISNAGLVNHHQSEPDLYVNGTVTCAEPTGQTLVSLLAVQIIDGIGTASGDVAVACASGAVFWEVELTGLGLHPGFINVLGESERNGVVEASTSQGFQIS